MKIILTIVALCFLWSIAIQIGWFPRYTDKCPNGRFVYMQDEHKDDKEKICAVLR